MQGGGFYLISRLKEQLGSGQFGVVHHGIWRIRSEAGCKDTDVAVKVTENGGKSEERVKFLQEAVIMGQFKNPYILQIFGIINDDHVSINLCTSLLTSELQYLLLMHN